MCLKISTPWKAMMAPRHHVILIPNWHCSTQIFKENFTYLKYTKIQFTCIQIIFLLNTGVNHLFQLFMNTSTLPLKGLIHPGSAERNPFLSAVSFIIFLVFYENGGVCTSKDTYLFHKWAEGFWCVSDYITFHWKILKTKFHKFNEFINRTGNIGALKIRNEHSAFEILITPSYIYIYYIFTDSVSI